MQNKDWRKKYTDWQKEQEMKAQESFTNEFLEDVLKKSVITHTPTFARLLKEGRRGSDAMALYSFYCYCASWQKTTSVYATDFFCRKGLSWGSDRFRNAKNLLLKLKIISHKVSRNPKTNQIEKHFIRIHYLKKPE